MGLLTRIFEWLLPAALAPVETPPFLTGDRVEYIAEENIFPPHQGTVLWCWEDKVKVQWDGFAQMRWVESEAIRRI